MSVVTIDKCLVEFVAYELHSPFNLLPDFHTCKMFEIISSSFGYGHFLTLLDTRRQLKHTMNICLLGYMLFWRLYLPRRDEL